MSAVDPCSCSDWHGCIMRSSVAGEDGIQPYKFSGCSVDQYQQWMEQGSALCLLNRPRYDVNQFLQYPKTIILKIFTAEWFKMDFQNIFTNKIFLIICDFKHYLMRSTHEIYNMVIR